MIRRGLGMIAARAIATAAVRAAVTALTLAVAAALTPATLVAAGALAVASRRTWEPRRLFVAAAWCAPMVMVWLAATATGSAGWLGAATAPYHAWPAFWHLVGSGAYLRAAARVAPAAIPLGLAGAGLAWSYRTRTVGAGAGGRSPASSVALDQRQWRNQVRAAKARIAAPGSVPLTMRGDLIAAGAVIRTVGHRAGPLATIGYERMRSHQVVIGTTGTGKTTLLLRLWAAYLATGLRRQAAGCGAAPLIVVLDCKGGASARRVADRYRRLMREAGARSVAVWPDEASLSLWSLPPRKLTTTLVDLIEHGTGSAAYYADVMEALVALAVEAPCGPPTSAADLLARLEPGWLALAYAASGTAADQAMIRSASRQLGDVALRFRTLFRRLGDGLDGPGSFGDAEAWYCILEGTDQIPVAEGQARALVDLLASFAVSGGGEREILLAVDEFSAVSRRLPIFTLYERARSLGLSVQVSAQSWQGLAATQDERYRISAAAEGGIWLLRTPHPEPVAGLAGTRKAIETTRALGRLGGWSRRGSSRLHDEPIVDLGLIRRLDTGQVAYIHGGGVTYVQIKRPVAAPAAVRGPVVAAADAVESLAGAVPAVFVPLSALAAVPSAVPGMARPPDISPVLDAAFGPEAP